MNCPVCQVALLMSDRQGIEIDYCPKCRGVWLDRGELDKIVERSLGGATPMPQHQAPAPRYGSHDAEYGREGHGYKKKQKSFLGEIFDFD